MKKILIIIISFLAISVIGFRIRFGGGEKFTPPALESGLSDRELEIVATLTEPPGNIAVSESGRIFVTLHPEAKPERVKVVEIIGGKPIPFPNLELQSELYHSPQGIRIDSQNRLWTIDHGDNGIQNARLVAIDLATNSKVHDYSFPRSVAGLFSYLQDLVIEPSGRYIFIADVNFFGKSPALVIYDSLTKKSLRVLENDSSVVAKNFVIQSFKGPMVRLGGLLSLKAGVDSIGLDKQGEFLYFAPMNHDRMFRIRTKDLIQRFDSPNIDFKDKVEDYSEKILSDGISLDLEGNIYLTDVEHQSIVTIDTNKKLKTSIQSPKLRWPDGLSFGPDGYLYIADSDIPEIVLESKESIAKAGPFYIFRYKPGFSGRIGH